MNLINRIKNWFIVKLDLNNDKCFKEHGKNGVCYGVMGGTSWTCYVDEHCIGCKHWKCYVGQDIKR